MSYYRVKAHKTLHKFVSNLCIHYFQVLLKCFIHSFISFVDLNTNYYGICVFHIDPTTILDDLYLTLKFSIAYLYYVG